MNNLITTQINQLAERFDLPQSEELYQVLKATAFKGEVTDAQLSALLIVAKQYGLNPWTKEIYAFPDKGGIVPVVGVDGWSRIINSNAQFDGIDFDQDGDSCTCIIHRKDRSHPTKVTEWMAECKRTGVKPWESHPYRMLRHKAMIQCARIAFGFGGIFDQDEAERIIENTGSAKVIDPTTGEITAKVANKAASLPLYTDEDFAKNMLVWRKVIASGKKDVAGVLATVATIATLTEDQIATIKGIPSEVVKAAGQRKPEAATGPAGAPTVSYAEIAQELNKAPDLDALNEAAMLIEVLTDEGQRNDLHGIYDKRAAALSQ